ncbi:MAG: hypothetical protein WC455_24410 [Dehalococcoidia bacterium]
MSYTITAWRETGMTTQDKVDGLNNLETMHSEAVSYIDAITHSERYYTEECDSKYFTSLTDGHTSGLICQTLDGMTADEIIELGCPSGCIVLWHGSILTIPAGYYLCNGANGTPDLRGKCVVGTGPTYAQGSSSGSNTLTTTASVTIGNHALTAAEIPLHTHTGIEDYYPHLVDSGPTGSGGYNMCSVAVTHDEYTGYAGSGTAHGHTATFAGTTDQQKMPPYYALAFVMRG